MVRLAIFALACLFVPGGAAADAVLFRLYLKDGKSVVSYGEFARVADRVVFSMIVGGGGEPRLHAATLPAAVIDWARTDAHATSTRYQWYARTRAELDFERLSDEVAAVLNAIVVSRDRTRALELAEQARSTLADWPRAHYGYRQQDVREILAVLDEAIADLRAVSGERAFNLALVAPAPEIALEPLAVTPSLQEQIEQAWRVALLTDRPAERVALLRAVIALVNEGGSAFPAREAARVRRLAGARIRHEERIDQKYTELGREAIAVATQAAAAARVADVQQVVDRIPREDARLGGLRPEIVLALRTSVQRQLEAARRLRLLRDQWAIRRGLFDDYQRVVGAQLLQLVKSQPALEAIRRLDGPAPDVLVELRDRLRGGTDRLGRIQPPADLRALHDLLVGAWRFAESAVNGRYDAARGADVSVAWQASSSAAGSLLLLARAQQEVRTFLDPPTLQ
jgi:hypothetical protein